MRVLKEGEMGLRLADICWKHGICKQTYSRWNSSFGGLDVGEARRLRQREEEGRRLKKSLADRVRTWHS